MNLKVTSKQTLLCTVTAGIILALSPLAVAQTEAISETNPAPSGPAGYLSDYHYQVASVSSMSDAQEIMNLETKDTKKHSVCSNRAELWTYTMNHVKGIQVGKVFVHFTPLGEADESKEWAYHVAPYIIVNGEEIVLDNGFGVFEGRPTPMKTWEKYFGKSENCIVLDPTHNPAHLALEQNNMPNDWVTPLTYTKGAARQYPTSLGICYIRKAPMYYAYPKDVYAADLNLAGQAQYSSFMMKDFDPGEVLFACKQATTSGFKSKHSCEKFTGLHKE